MTLRLKQIRLTNWKCYPSQNITFNLHPDRKIQIIFGNNGHGKTSLMTAILWCLYGGDIVSKETLKTYFYRGKDDSSSVREMRVELNFTKNDKNYFISRTAKLKVNGSTSYPSVEEALFYEDGTIRSNSREYIEGSSRRRRAPLVVSMPSSTTPASSIMPQPTSPILKPGTV